MIFFWGKCRCTICHCPNVTRNENHLCGACFHPGSADDDHQGLNQITLKPMIIIRNGREGIFSKLERVTNELLAQTFIAKKSKKKHECTDKDCQHDASKRMKQYD